MTFPDMMRAALAENQGGLEVALREIIREEIGRALDERPTPAPVVDGGDLREIVRAEAEQAINNALIGPLKTIADMWADLKAALEALKAAQAAEAAPFDYTAMAEAFYALPPASDHFGLPPNARFDSRFQEMLAIMTVNQAYRQEDIKAINEGAAGLRAGGYKPPR